MPSLNHMENLINSLGASLPDLSSAGNDPSSHSAIILIHTLTYASKIQLYSASNTLNYKAKSVEAARAAIDLISQWQSFTSGTNARAHGQPVLNPMFGVLWGMIGRALTASFDGVVVWRRDEVTHSLGRLIETMEAFGERSPLIGEMVPTL